MKSSRLPPPPPPFAKLHSLVLAGLLILTGCGGGGSGGGAQPSGNEIRQEAFIASASRALSVIQAAAVSDPVFGSVMQTTSRGVSQVIQGGITERGEELYLDVQRRDGSRLSLNSRDHPVEVVGLEYSPTTGRSVSNVYLLDVDNNSITAALMAADYNYEDVGDYWIAGGYWLHVSGDWQNGQVNGVEIGAIADGPEFSGTNSLPSSSTATYRGEGAAGGLYVGRYGTDGAVPSGTIEIGEYAGDFEARVNFDTFTVSGSVTNISYDGYYQYPDGRVVPDSGDLDLTLHMNNAQIEANGRITGNISISSPGVVITSNNGSWGSQLSSVNDASGNPRAMAGTHGGSFTTAGGTEASYVGAHFGTTGRF